MRIQGRLVVLFLTTQMIHPAYGNGVDGFPDAARTFSHVCGACVSMCLRELQISLVKHSHPPDASILATFYYVSSKPA